MATKKETTEAAAPSLKNEANVERKFVGEANPHRPKQKSGDEDSSFQGTIGNVKSELKSQPKRRVLIPSTPGEPKNTYETITINGYPTHIKKGVYVDVPAAVADIVEESLNKTTEAYSNPVSDETGEPLNLEQASEETKKALNPDAE